MFNVAVVENDTKYSEAIIAFLLQYGFDEKAIHSFKSADACRNLGDKYNLYFLDTTMPGTKGIQYLDELRRENCYVVMVSENEKYLYDAFDINVIGFVLKQNLEMDLKKALSKLQSILKGAKKISFTSNNNTIFLYIDDIVYIESDLGDLIFYLKDGTIQKILNHTLASIEEQLEANFLYCNRSTLVNMEYVIAMNQDELSFKNHESIIISRRKIKQIQTEFIKQKMEEQEL